MNKTTILTSTSEQNGGRHDTGHISNRTYLAKAPGHCKQARKSEVLMVVLDMFPCDLAKAGNCESPYLAGSIVICDFLIWLVG